MKYIYYGWIIVGVGVLVKMAGLGFGRFALTLFVSLTGFFACVILTAASPRMERDG